MSDNNRNELTVFETIRKNTELEVSEEKKYNVPSSMVFGHGTIGNVPSFGGSTLLENSKKVDEAIANIEPLFNIWNNSHTQWDWKHFNLSWHDEYFNMRQIMLEVNSLKDNINSAKWQYVDNEIKVKKLEEKLEDPDIGYWEEVETKIELAKIKEGMEIANIRTEGMMKNVLQLNEMYEDLKSKLSNFSEEDVEKNQTVTHLKRPLVQSIRDIRQSAYISKGEQEYLEQIGANPSKVQDLLRNYVDAERESENWDVSDLYEFVDKLARELTEKHEVDKVRMKLTGVRNEANPAFAYNKILALKKEE